MFIIFLKKIKIIIVKINKRLSYLTLEVLDMDKICNDGLGIIEFL